MHDSPVVNGNPPVENAKDSNSDWTFVEVMDRYGWVFSILLGAVMYKYFGTIPVIVFVIGYIVTDLFINLNWGDGSNPSSESPLSEEIPQVDEFPVGSEHNPAKNLGELPNRTGVVVKENGDKYWYKNYMRYREDGPAIEYANGSKSWYMNDKFHREDGPAFEGVDGETLWYRHGDLHREDGPAVEWKDGHHEEYWLHGRKLTQEEFKTQVQNMRGTTKDDPIAENLPLEDTNPSDSHDTNPIVTTDGETIPELEATSENLDQVPKNSDNVGKTS